MSKCDITIGKKFTLNTGNFSSIQPTVSITIHNVDSDKINEVHELAEIITDALLHKQIESDAKTMSVIKKLGFSDYFKEINTEEMNRVLEESIRKIGSDITF